MDLLEDLNQLESAEEFFEYFDLPYDEARMNVIRLHLLKNFRSRLDAIDANQDPAAYFAAAKAALAQAWCEQSKPDAPKQLDAQGPCSGCDSGCNSEIGNFAALDVFDKFAASEG